MHSELPRARRDVSFGKRTGKCSAVSDWAARTAEDVPRLREDREQPQRDALTAVTLTAGMWSAVRPVSTLWVPPVLTVGPAPAGSRPHGPIARLGLGLRGRVRCRYMAGPREQHALEGDAGCGCVDQCAPRRRAGHLLHSPCHRPATWTPGLALQAATAGLPIRLQ